MTAMHTLGLCMVLLVSVLLLGGAGVVVLRLLKVAGTSAADTFLFSIALGVIILDLAVSLGELAPLHRIGLQIAIAAMALFGLAGVKHVFLNSRELAQAFASLARTEKWLASALLVALALQGVASFAPLTGSDALHYHFTMQSLVWSEGFHANWSLLHGFFCGLSHQPILAGIALGSGSLAQGWLFLAIYSRPAWSAVAGRTSQDAYLKANSPDYERSQFVNREVARFAEDGRVLVFFWPLLLRARAGF